MYKVTLMRVRAAIFAPRNTGNRQSFIYSPTDALVIFLEKQY